MQAQPQLVSLVFLIFHCLIVNVLSFQICATESRIPKYLFLPTKCQKADIQCQHFHISGLHRYLMPELMGRGEKFERKKVQIAEKVELFSSKIFLVHMEAEVLQEWLTTHFKACSK